MKKIISVAVATLLAAALFTGCAGNQTSTLSPSPSANVTSSSSITASGSTALQPLLQLAVDPFKAKHGASFTGSITINGGGSGQGLTDVSAGTVLIGNSDVTPEQAGKSGTGLVDNKVCVVAVGVVVTGDVYQNLTNISTADLTNVFNGTLKDWKEVKGWKGASKPIQVFYRKAGSGTRTLFETFGTGTKLTDAQLGAFENFTKKESSGDLETAIANGTGAIGYETLPYCKNLKLLSVDGVECKYDNVYTGTYKIWGYEHMFTKGEPTGAVKTFIDFVMSKDFEKTITDKGYGLSSLMKVSR